MSEDTPLLEFRNVSLSFDRVNALNEVSFILKKGQILFVTGASGSGKSILLRLALGLLQPDSGQVFLHGQDLGRLTEDELLKLRGRAIGMVFQEQAAFTGLSVFENTAFSLNEHGCPAEQVENETLAMLRFVGLQEDADKLPEELSGGMERRLEVARSLIGWPPVMLYDEPVNGLDPLNALQVMNLIVYARDVKTVTSIYVTKNMNEIRLLAHRYAVKTGISDEWKVGDNTAQRPDAQVILLDEGRIIFTGPPDEFFSSRLPAAVRLTEADNGTVLSDFYTPDPWDKTRLTKLKTDD